MATKITDIVVAEVLADAVRAAFAGGVNALWGTGAAVINGSLPAGRDKVGTSVKIPYFSGIGEWEAIVDGSAFTPTKITMSEEEDTVIKIGKAFSITDWATFAAVGDPYEEAARQMKSGFQAKVDKLLIEKATASLAAMTVDVYSATTPRVIDSDLVIDGRAKFGDEAGDRALLVCHSKVENDMRKIKRSDGSPMFMDPSTGGLGKFAGYPVGMSDRMTASSATPPKYTTLLSQPGALVCWYNGEPVVETGRDILATADVIVVSTYAVVHRYVRMQDSTKPGIALLQHN